MLICSNCGIKDLDNHENNRGYQAKAAKQIRHIRACGPQPLAEFSPYSHVDLPSKE